MDKLKPYAIPILGLVVLVVYWFAVRPMLQAQPEADAKADTKK